MSPKVAFSALLFAAAVLASAQSVNVTFPDSGDRQVWASSAATGAPTDSSLPHSAVVHSSDASATVSTAGLPPTAFVFVSDQKTGNLAEKSIKDIGGSTWAVKPSDFQWIATVAVNVQHDGKPVAAATVDLDDGKNKVTELLAPSNAGMVSFYSVAPGSIKITVHYKVAGKEGKPVTQLLDASLTRTDVIPTATISLADAVDTVGGTAGTSPIATSSPAATSTPSAGAAKTKEGPASVIGSILLYLIVLGGMGAAIYYGIQYMNKNGDSVSSKLEQMGVQIPKPGDDPLTSPAAVPMPKAPAPVQKIILDDAAPDLLAPVATSKVITDPRLVSLTGDMLPLPQGDLVVGREVGLGLSLVGESTVSRRHAQISRSGNTLVVTDFGSTNGTFVNGVQVQGEKQLSAGDILQFGSVRFRLEG